MSKENKHGLYLRVSVSDGNEYDEGIADSFKLGLVNKNEGRFA